jgi:sulfur carrier protein
MRVIINGNEETIEAGITLAELLRRRNAEPKRVAVEVNRELVVRGDHDRTPLQEGDRIEIVTFVGGG